VGYEGQRTVVLASPDTAIILPVIEVIPNLSGKRVKTYPPGRVCSTCSTKLSIYNARHQCAACYPVNTELKKREHNDALLDLAAFLEET
jgi:hypothetical protein